MEPIGDGGEVLRKVLEVPSKGCLEYLVVGLEIVVTCIVECTCVQYGCYEMHYNSFFRNDIVHTHFPCRRKTDSALSPA